MDINQTSQTRNPSSSQRNVVDFGATILLFLLIITWFGIGMFAHLIGNIKSLLHPKDSFGRSCGLDYLVEKKPFLQYFDVTNCDDAGIPFGGCDSKRACVVECPKKVFLSSKMGGDSELICLRGPEYLNSSTDCAQWYLPSAPYQGRCVPNSVPDEDTLKEISVLENRKVDAKTIKRSIKNIKIISEVSHGTKLFMSEILKYYWKILLAAFLILLTSFAWFFVFIQFTRHIFLFSLIVVPCCITYFLLHAYRKYFFYKNTHNSNQEIANFKKYAWLGTAILCTVAAFFLFFMTCFWVSETFKGVNLIKIFNSKMKYASILVIISWVQHVLIFTFFISTFVHLGNIYENTSYNVTADDKCKEVLKNHNIDLVAFACDPEYFTLRNKLNCNNVFCHITPLKAKQYLFLQLYNALMYIFMSFFILSIQQMTIGLTLSYPVSIKFLFSSLGIVYRYHMGTALIGAILIALYKYLCLKLILIWTARKSKASKAISRLSCCILYWRFNEKIYNVIDTGVLNICVIFNKSFLKGSRLYRKVANPESLKRVKNIGSIYYILFYQKLMITFICTGVCYLLIYFLKSDTPIAYSFLVVLFTLYFSYVTCSLIFGVYTMKLDAYLIYILISFSQGEYDLENMPSSSLPNLLLEQ
ncbi:choline transporter-like protein 2 [Anthonomus grandis grandis]|uniref:choline transporter-like protein 2 n=1 Tax=Anthonomus grandis grandis TaxID=2921223 RepID=UPI002166581A|nr:choline transporter-like protein 2 [Anthonomus grandis grandis]